MGLILGRSSPPAQAPTWDPIPDAQAGVPLVVTDSLNDPDNVVTNVRILNLPTDATYDHATGTLTAPTGATGLQARAQYPDSSVNAVTFSQITSDIVTRGGASALLCNTNFPAANHVEDHSFEVKEGRAFPTNHLAWLSDNPDGAGGSMRQTIRSVDGSIFGSGSTADWECNFAEVVGSGGSLTSRLTTAGTPTPMCYGDGGTNDLGSDFYVLWRQKWDLAMFDNDWILDEYDGGWKFLKIVMGDWLDTANGNALRRERSAQVAELTGQNLDYVHQPGWFFSNSNPYLLEDYVPPLAAHFGAGEPQVGGFNQGFFAEIDTNVSNSTSYTDSNGVQHAQRSDAATFANQIITGTGADHPYVRQATQWGYSALNVGGAGTTGRSVIVDGDATRWQPKFSQLIRDGLRTDPPIEYDSHARFWPNEWMTFLIHVTLGPVVSDYWTDSRIQFWAAREGQALTRWHDTGAIWDIPQRTPTRYGYGRLLFTPFSTNLMPSGTDGTTRIDAHTYVTNIVTSTILPLDPFTGSVPPDDNA